jgi:hypothetical protein
MSNIHIDKRVAEFIAKMNALGLTPVVDITEDHTLVAFSLREFLAGMKKSLIKSGVPEEKIIVEVVPFKDDRYIKVVVKKR